MLMGWWCWLCVGWELVEMDGVEKIGCCELMCFELSKVLEDDGILIPFSSSKILTIRAICQIVYDPNCDELVVCVDHRTSCD